MQTLSPVSQAAFPLMRAVPQCQCSGIAERGGFHHPPLAVHVERTYRNSFLSWNVFGSQSVRKLSWGIVPNQENMNHGRFGFITLYVCGGEAIRIELDSKDFCNFSIERISR
jgi:hypothetical protein